MSGPGAGLQRAFKPARTAREVVTFEPARRAIRFCALHLREDARGLFAEGQLNLAVQRAREVDALMRGGALDGLSIGFRTLQARPGAGGERRLLRLDLWEVSLVTFPLQPGARASPSPGADAIRGLARRIHPARNLSRNPALRPLPAARP